MEISTALEAEFAAGTDVGCRRPNNEDSFGYDAARHIYAVCDGMGGMAAGEIASATAVRELVGSFDAASRLIPAPPVEQRLLDAIRSAHAAVRELAASDPRLSGMGTTLVCACLDGNRIVVGNVGDSRAYFARDGQCFQITLDHSFLAEQLSRGLITPEMAAASDMQSVITRAIGVHAEVEPDLFAADLRADDVVLLASDGLTRYATDEEIRALLSSGKAPSILCQALIDLAKARGGADNITCIVLRLVAEPVANSDASPQLL